MTYKKLETVLKESGLPPNDFLNKMINSQIVLHFNLRQSYLVKVRWDDRDIPEAACSWPEQCEWEHRDFFMTSSTEG